MGLTLTFCCSKVGHENRAQCRNKHPIVRTKPATRKVDPIIDSKEEDQVACFINKGVTEWHTHWNGILDPFKYVNCWYPLAAVDACRQDVKKQNDQRAAYYYARKAIVSPGCKVSDKQLIRSQKHIVDMLRDVDDDDMYELTKHVLSASTDESIFSSRVHWNLAYEFRGIIRDDVKNSCTEYSKYKIVPLEKLLNQSAIDEWFDKKDGDWVIDIVHSIQEKCKNRLPALVRRSRTAVYKVVDYGIINKISRTANRLSEKYVQLFLSGGCSGTLNIKHSIETIKYNYADAILTELRRPENNVVRAEISSVRNADICNDVVISSILLSSLCKKFPIDTTKLELDTYPDKPRIFTTKFFHAILTEKLTKSKITRDTIEEIKNAVTRENVIGVDFLGREVTFNAKTVDNIFTVYSVLVKSVEEYKARSSDNKKSSRKLVLRIHVGESNMINNKFDEEQEKKGRNNVQTVLNAISVLIEEGHYNDNVRIRLGHITALTIGQAYFIRKHCIHFEINSISNTRTYAVQDKGHLPILKILIADAAYRYKNRDGSENDNFRFTCNTDGNGLMKCNLKEEYKLNLALMRLFTENKTLIDGTRPTVYVFKDDESAEADMFFKPEHRKHCSGSMTDREVLDGLLNGFDDELKSLRGANEDTVRIREEYRNFKYYMLRYFEKLDDDTKAIKSTIKAIADTKPDSIYGYPGKGKIDNAVSSILKNFTRKMPVEYYNLEYEVEDYLNKKRPDCVLKVFELNERYESIKNAIQGYLRRLNNDNKMLERKLGMLPKGDISYQDFADEVKSFTEPCGERQALLEKLNKIDDYEDTANEYITIEHSSFKEDVKGYFRSTIDFLVRSHPEPYLDEQ